MILGRKLSPKEKHRRIKLGWRWRGLYSCFWDSTRDLRKIQAHRSLLDRCVTPTSNSPPTLPPSKTGSVRFNEHSVSPKKQTPKYWAKANQYKVVPKINKQFLPEAKPQTFRRVFSKQYGRLSWFYTHTAQNADFEFHRDIDPDSESIHRLFCTWSCPIRRLCSTKLDPGKAEGSKNTRISLLTNFFPLFLHQPQIIKLLTLTKLQNSESSQHLVSKWGYQHLWGPLKIQMKLRFFFSFSFVSL